MKKSGEVTIERAGKTYSATYQLEGEMLKVSTHTEVRNVQLGANSPESLARTMLAEIVDANRPK